MITLARALAVPENEATLIDTSNSIIFYVE